MSVILDLKPFRSFSTFFTQLHASHIPQEQEGLLVGNSLLATRYDLAILFFQPLQSYITSGSPRYLSLSITSILFSLFHCCFPGIVYIYFIYWWSAVQLSDLFKVYKAVYKIKSIVHSAYIAF